MSSPTLSRLHRSGDGVIPPHARGGDRPPSVFGRDTLWLLLVLLAAFGAYFGVWENEFVYDSKALIERNERVHGLDRIGEIFRTEYWNLEGVESRLYRPLTLTSYALQWGPSQGDPGPFHLANLFLHLLAVALLWRFLVLALEGGSATSPAGLAALVGTAFFALTPVHSEAVIAVVGRADLFVALALLSALLALRAAESRPFWFPLAAILGGVAALSKESGFLLPAWIVAAHLGGFLGSRASTLWRPLLRNLVWTGLGWVPVLVLRLLALRDVAPPVVHLDDNALAESGGLERWVNASRFFWRYLELHVRPDWLSADHGYRALEARVVSEPTNVAATFALGAIVICLLVWALRRSHRSPSPLGLGLALYVGTLLASGNFFFLIGTTFGERLSYLPHVGLALAVAAATRFVLSRVSGGSRHRDIERVSVPAIGIAVVLLLPIVVSANATRARVQDWRGDESLFIDATEAQPRSFRVWGLRGNGLLVSGAVDSARVALLRSVELYDRYPQARVDLVALEYNAGNFAVAAEHAARLREIVPNHVYGYLAIAESALRQGDLSTARKEIDVGRERHPQSVQLAELAGRIGLQSQEWARAQEGFRAAVAMDPRNGSSWRGLAAASLGAGDWDEAVRAYSSWAQFDTGWEPINGWAWSLYQRAARASGPDRERDLGEAAQLSRRAVELAPTDYWRYAANTLSYVLVAQEEVAEARELLEELVRRHPEEASFAGRLRQLE